MADSDEQKGWAWWQIAGCAGLLIVGFFAGILLSGSGERESSTGSDFEIKMDRL
jgi:hypothetical protein